VDNPGVQVANSDVLVLSAFLGLTVASGADFKFRVTIELNEAICRFPRRVS
jgi:hypothetical protein